MRECGNCVFLKMEDVITLSSDEEQYFDGPAAKKRKSALNFLNNLSDVSAVPRVIDKIENKSNPPINNILTIIIQDQKSPNGIKNGHNLSDPDVTVELEDDLETKPLMEQKTAPEDNGVAVVIDDASDGEHNSEIKIANINMETTLGNLELKVNTSNIEDHCSIKITTNPEENNGNQIMSDLRTEETSGPSTSTSTSSGVSDLVEQFILICDKHFESSRFAEKLQRKMIQVRENFSKCTGIHQDFNFKKMLLQEISAAEQSALCAVHSFQRIYTYLMDHVVGQTIEVEEDDMPKIKKLDKAMRLILKKIKQLENEEIDFSDEENSSYLQLERYTERLNKIHVKYCQLIKRNPHVGRLLYDKIQFVSAKHNEINYAITKLVKRNTFPTYYDVEKCVRKCVTESKLPLSEGDIKDESLLCFKRIGDLMQSRRKKELYEVHSASGSLNEDPALKDPELSKKLKISYEEGEKKLKEVIEAFVKKQENNVVVEDAVDPDSDDSNHKSSGTGSEEDES